MDSQARCAEPSVAERLQTQADQFEFFRLVQLLECLAEDCEPVGCGSDPSREAIRFGATPDLLAQPPQVTEIRYQPEASEQRVPALVRVAFMGLIGPLGVLPRHYTTLVNTLLHRDDPVLRDFLDLFHHRLVSLFYRAWEKSHFPAAYERVARKGRGDDAFTRYVFSLVGMGTDGLRGRLDVNDEALLFYAGLLAQQPRSASALKSLLQDYFAVPVHIEQWVGRRLRLPVEQWTRLGHDASNNALGITTIAGSNAWSTHSKFRVCVGPLGYDQFCQFLPIGDAFQPLVDLSRFFVGQEFGFDVQLTLRANDVPACRLGGTQAQSPRLGWSTWLTTANRQHDADEAIFSESYTPCRSKPTQKGMPPCSWKP